MTRRLTAVVAALVLATACASEPDTSTDDEIAQSDDQGGDSGKKAKKDEAPKKNGRRGKKRPDRTGSPEDASAGAQGKSTRSEDRDEGDPSEDGSDDNSRVAAYPEAGTYTYAQSGHEEFCNNAGNCDKEKLPPRQPSRLRYESSSSDSALVVATQRVSDAREMKTWTRFTPGGAHITEVYVEFNYSGFTFNRTYRPDPPVEAARFPLRSGDAWSGEWKASTSGSYSVRIGERTQMDVGGRTVTVIPVDTTTDFRGDFEGRSRITAYMDPDTKAIVATEGALNVSSNFGRYSTVFETKLLDGPRY